MTDYFKIERATGIIEVNVGDKLRLPDNSVAIIYRHYHDDHVEYRLKPVEDDE